MGEEVGGGAAVPQQEITVAALGAARRRIGDHGRRCLSAPAVLEVPRRRGRRGGGRLTARLRRRRRGLAREQPPREARCRFSPDDRIGDAGEERPRRRPVSHKAQRGGHLPVRRREHIRLPCAAAVRRASVVVHGPGLL